jgi:Uncharacterized protein conserved in bacteria (DUF2330)
MFRVVLPGTLVFLLLCRFAVSAWGCATVFPQNQAVHFADQSVVIFWDATNRIEHLIRKATFEADTHDFGFFVPTPTKPILAEANDAAFDALERITAQQSQWEWTFKPFLCSFIGCGTRKDSRDTVDGRAKVRLLDAQRLAGYDAAVLEADDAKALAGWLTSNGYFFRPELTAWLDYYVDKKWKITAFKIAHDPKSGRPLTTSAVRMSFPTDKPFFPYRVPDETKPERRLLRIFMVSNERLEGNLGDGKKWSGKTVWADRLAEGQRTSLANSLGLDEKTLPTDAWLTTFDDATFPNPRSDDVYFRPDSSQSVLHRPPLLRTVWIPSDIAVGLGALILFRLVTRKIRAAVRSET